MVHETKDTKWDRYTIIKINNKNSNNNNNNNKKSQCQDTKKPKKIRREKNKIKGDKEWYYDTTIRLCNVLYFMKERF